MATTQHTLDAAMQGDLSALTKLQTLCRQNQRILGQALLVASRHLQASTPPSPESSKSHTHADQKLPHMQDIVAIFVLEILDIGSPEKGGAETMHAYTVMLAQIEDIVRWMTYLFPCWALKNRGEIHDTTGTPHLPDFDLDSIPSRVLSTIPTVLEKMSRHPDISTLLQDNAKIGILLSRMFIISTRDQSHDMLLSASKIYSNLKEDHPWRPIFLENLEVQRDVVADGIVSWIKRIGDAPAPQAYTAHLATILAHCASCSVERTLLDTFLKTNGFIQVLMLIFNALIGIKHVRNDQRIRERPISKDAFPAIFYTSKILLMCITRCGASLATVILKNNMLISLMSLLDRSSITRRDLRIPRDIDEVLSAFVQVIPPLMVYPSIFWETRRFFVDYWNKSPPERTRLPELHAAMLSLSDRLHEEYLLIIGYIQPMNKRTCSSSDPTRFCDNAQCPTVGKIEDLGQCCSCLSAYYCSLHCQKFVWKNGHREECRNICDSRRGGREGFPPLLTLHDHAYFAKTLLSRLEYYTAVKSMESPTVNTVVDIDFTASPITITYSDSESQEDSLEHLGQLIRAKYPTCEMLGQFVEITMYLNA